MHGCEEGVVQRGSGENSKLQSKDCHSSKVQNIHRGTSGVQEEVPVAII